MQFKPCVACKENDWRDGEEQYVGFYKCNNCGFYGDFKTKEERKPTIHVPEDPMDALLCEGCQ